MAGYLNGAEIDIPCPSCGHKIKKSIGWLQSHDNLTCGGCRKVIKIEGGSDFRDAMREVDASLDELTESFKNFGR